MNVRSILWTLWRGRDLALPGRGLPSDGAANGKRSDCERRRSVRPVERKRASLVIDHREQPERVPCVVVDSSGEGFKIVGPSRLKRGERVELILDEFNVQATRCRVIWTGHPGSKQEGEAGLQICDAARRAQAHPLVIGK
jgi:hypothetical protein